MAEEHVVTLEEKIKHMEDKQREFASIRFFPTLVAARRKGFANGAVLLEDKRIRLEREKREKAFLNAKERTPKKTISAFRPTKEITSLSDLREQFKKRAEFETSPNTTTQNATIIKSIHRTPFRPTNPSEARKSLNNSRMVLAKTPFEDDPKYQNSGKSMLARIPERVEEKKVWKPSSSAPVHVDAFLNAPDVESRRQNMERLEAKRRKRLEAFKDSLTVRNAQTRNDRLFRFFNRVNFRHPQHHSPPQQHIDQK